jgi:hypothetical protein
MNRETPPDEVLIEAAKRCGWDTQIEGLRRLYSKDSPFRALCDMIEQNKALTVEIDWVYKRIEAYKRALGGTIIWETP